MTSNYKILGQVDTSSTNKVLYQTPAGKEAVVSTVAVANTTSDDGKFTIFAQRVAPLGDSWQYVPSMFNNQSNTLTSLVNTGSKLMAFFSGYPTYSEYMQQSTDGGETWTYISKTGLNGEYDSYRVRANEDGSRLVLVTNQKEVYVSVDTAATWTKIADPLSFSGYVLEAAATDTEFVVVGIDTMSNVLKCFVSTDGLTMTESTSSDIADIVLTNASQYGDMVNSDYYTRSLVVGSDIYMSLSYYLNSFGGGGSGGSGGGGGGGWVSKLIKTSDAGSTWTEINLSSFFTATAYGNYPTRISSIKNVNSKIVIGFDYANYYNMMTSTSYTEYAKLLVSSDSGTTWAEKLIPGNFAARVSDIQFTNNKYYLVAAYAGSSGGGNNKIVSSSTLDNLSTAFVGAELFSGELLVKISPEKMISTGKYISTTNYAPSTKNAIAYGTTLAGYGIVNITSGITLAAGEKLSVGDQNFSGNMTYTAFGSEVTP